MSDGDEVITVPWNGEAWERAIRQRRDVGRVGGDADGGGVLFTPGRLLVDARAAQEDEVRDELRRAGATACEEPATEIAERLGLTLFTVADDALIETVRRIRAVAPGAASLDHVLAPGPLRGHGDGLPSVTSDPGDIPGDDGSAGAGRTIHVLDTGIAREIPFAAPAAAGDAEIEDEDGDRRRDHAAGHGTHVAGIIARTAPGAKIIVRRVLRTPVGLVTELDAAAAIAEAGAAGADVVNCSFGGATLFDAAPLALERALERLPVQTVVVAAAGNQGAEQPHWPAASKGVIAVGSVGCDKDGAWKRTDFSNFGNWVDCCAPGVAVASAFLHSAPDTLDDPPFRGWATWSGTSFSAPAVAAAIAALATRDSIPPSLAAHRLITDPARPRVARVGTLVL